MAVTSQSAVPADQQRSTSVVVSLVVCIFAVGAFLPIRSLWVQLPGTLAAESSSRHLPLLVICLLSNVIAVVYLVVRRCCCRLSTECVDAAAIYIAVTCGLASLGLLTVSDASSTAAVAVARLLPSWPAATALLTAAGLGAAAASLAAVTYIPFAGRLGRNCVCMVLIGDALSSLIPHILAVTQGYDCTVYSLTL